MKKEREVSGRTKSITQVGDGMKASGNRNYQSVARYISHLMNDEGMRNADFI